MADLDIFRDEFVPNIETHAKLSFTTWKKTAPADYQRWVSYRDALLAGQSPSSPAMTTKYGKALVAAGRLVMQQGQPPNGGQPLRYWSDTCIWNTPLPANPTLDADSEAKITRLIGGSGSLANPALQTKFYGSAIVQTTGADPTYTFACSYEPTCAINTLGPVPVPAGTLPDPGSDGHLVIVDVARQYAWEFWVYQSPGNCLNGRAWTLAGSGGGATPGGAVATRTPMLPILVRPEEITAGEIRHAIAGSLYHLDSTRSARIGHVWPAVADDGASSNVLDLYEGTCLQLNPSLDVDGLAITSWEKTIARAMQTYGWYAIDKGGAWSVKCESRREAAWTALGLGADFPAFSANFPWASLRVLAPPTSQTYPYWG